MKFFGVHIEDLESERFLTASNDQIATWLFLHALCCKQCNGGTIADARTLPDRFWSRHGIEKSILDLPSPLWSWSGDSLSVEPYDIDGQRVYERKVAGGKSRAKQRWGCSEERSPNRTPNKYCNTPDPTRPEKKNTSSGDEADDHSAESKPYIELFDYWNGQAVLPKIRSYTTNRKRTLTTRMKEPFFRDNWKAAIDGISATPFLRGENDRGWKADIDWFLKPDTVAKIIEEKYSATAAPHNRELQTSQLGI